MPYYLKILYIFLYTFSCKTNLKIIKMQRNLVNCILINIDIKYVNAHF